MVKVTLSSAVSEPLLPAVMLTKTWSLSTIVLVAVLGDAITAGPEETESRVMIIVSPASLALSSVIGMLNWLDVDPDGMVRLPDGAV